MTELINIKVIQKEIDGGKKRFVNARELHQWLGVGRDFSNWIKDRIAKYDFMENLDYFVAIAKFGDGFNVQSKGKIVDAKTGKVLAKEYIISLDMAKELAMVENSEIGKKVRKYFIRVEDDFKKVMQIAVQDPKFINQLATQFAETREETKEYRRDFTDSVKNFIEAKSYGTYTDMLYDFLFMEKAKEYRKLLSLVKKDFTRNTMYEEILLIIGAFETGLAGEVEKEFKKISRMLTKDEFIKVFKEFSAQKNWLVYQKRARNIMATYDEELRNVKHPKLIDYKKEFSQEDIQKLLS
ncbi:MAG: antA/AntB antirepressor family protein [Candidatus Peregrinibacteria bacterium]|nr:antA/AntB antirepressor family protein [Candidatus Peregrinibacteria bacterium]